MRLWWRSILGANEAKNSGKPMAPRRPRSWGAILVLVLLGGFFLWAAFVPLSKGVVAPGIVVVDSKRKTIQHLEGGVIKAIHVREGAHVEEGALLLELDDAKARADRDTVRSRYLSKLATFNRLQALLKGEKGIAFDEVLRSAQNEPMVAQVMRLEEAMFRVMLQEHLGRQSIAEQKVGQLQEKLRGLEAYREATRQQVKVLQAEVDRLDGLMQKKLVEFSQVAERMQQLSQQQGELERTVAAIAETQVAISEAQLAVLQVEREWRQELAKQLTETQEALVELGSQLRAAQNVLDRTVIKAPTRGRVLGLKATTVGGVVTPGNPIMDIVPEDDRLVIEAHVRPLDVDSVRPGMDAHVKFTSFRARTMPDVLGRVEHVSADVLVDPAKGEPYYLMRVQVSGDELRKLSGKEIVPGMPAEVYVDAGSRTLLQYLFDPIGSMLRKSLREE